MYPLIFLLVVLMVLAFFTNLYQRKKKIKKIQNLCTDEKCKRLNELINPLGYYYNHCRDSFHTTIDAWQRDFGYGHIYDSIAYHFNMIFDCLPVYFNYAGNTWLIEIWKGQYGINMGAEVGVYKSDRILSPGEYDSVIFQPVSNEELFPLCLNINLNQEKITGICQYHWWLTAFKMGRFANPKDICLDVRITFPNYEMLNAFIDALSNTPYAPEDIHGKRLAVEFKFNTCPTCNYGFFKKKYINYIQCKNLFSCTLFNWITKPFVSSMDQILYLYEYAPFAFRKLFTIHSRKLYKKGCKKTNRK